MPIDPAKPFTFTVVGDNRGDSAGNPSPVFLRIIEAINASSPNLILNTGDLINGYEREERAHLLRLWKGYKKAIARLKAPIFHAPGNHDIFDPVSANLWKELWGPTYYSFDYASARFIALDTETEESRLGNVQLEWLNKQIEEAGKRHIFLFLHKPLFPVNGHIGSSLDKHPQERDRLLQLFCNTGTSSKGFTRGTNTCIALRSVMVSPIT